MVLPPFLLNCGKRFGVATVNFGDLHVTTRQLRMRRLCRHRRRYRGDCPSASDGLELQQGPIRSRRSEASYSALSLPPFCLCCLARDRALEPRSRVTYVIVTAGKNSPVVQISQPGLQEDGSQETDNVDLLALCRPSRNF
jgi:hypothetical protein